MAHPHRGAVVVDESWRIYATGSRRRALLGISKHSQMAATILAHRHRVICDAAHSLYLFDGDRASGVRFASPMSQVETNLEIFETPPAARNGHLNGEASRASTRTEPIRSEFLIKLSHDMRTPLNSILGVSQMMLEAGGTDSQKEYAETVAESAHALALLADMLADFPRYLELQDAMLQAHPIELNGSDFRFADGDSNGNGIPRVSASAQQNQGVEEMLSNLSTNPGRATLFNGAANFSTRVPPDTAKQIRILVAEDHLMNQRVILRMLERLGYTAADAVCNGAEAVAALTRNPYDIVLMDCQMSELDGYEATRQIRRSGGRFKSTLIIAVTANAMVGDREKCLASGMDDYMSKPLAAQTLATTLEKWILPDTAVGAITPPESAPAAAPSEVPLTADQAQLRSLPETSALEEVGPVPVPIGNAVDPAALETLRSMDAGDEGFMAKIIELFLSDLGERLEGIKVAVEAYDGPALKRIGHALKGSCGHFGAARLAMLSRQIELVGTQYPVIDATAIYVELEAEAARVRLALEEAMKISSTNQTEGSE
jgi:CheY-like chemotaxis protein/HPt (histidine-containing phosphotransfer) domain-containing protein